MVDEAVPVKAPGIYIFPLARRSECFPEIRVVQVALVEPAVAARCILRRVRDRSLSTIDIDTRPFSRPL